MKRSRLSWGEGDRPLYPHPPRRPPLSVRRAQPVYATSNRRFLFRRIGLHTVSTEACSVRVVSWVTLLFGLCISTSYSAVLFSRLTVDKSDLGIPTLESVARQRTHVLCVRRTSFGALLFKVAARVVIEFWIPSVTSSGLHRL